MQGELRVPVQSMELLLVTVLPPTASHMDRNPARNCPFVLSQRCIFQRAFPGMV